MERDIEDQIALDAIEDTGPWEITTCPRCGSTCETRLTNLRAVAQSGDETVAVQNFRPLREEG